ncbi:hypothetical protein GGR39_003277 [Novosphingobium fluoreni]|uniref:CHAD domain-containing protein n=1 Tax=Novosphingobium fluoreni TaxID=1391222 RepID=A0A7W6FZR8_9SPHN|nr:hypothetical protein [Novosphingobium fluoreni]MBB3941596.1 hypothetical protein [Novosphingobium fluoreni]
MTARAPFPPSVVDALFEAVEMDDVVDPVVSLPDPIPMACDAAEMRRCLDLCLQFWREGAIRQDLLSLTGTLLRTGDLPPDQRRRYKLIRARYKHLRFALVLYSAAHRAPLLFRATVAVMGHLQDAYRNDRHGAARRYALVLRSLLTWPVWRAVQRQVGTLRLDDAKGFLRYRLSELQRLSQWLAAETLTAHRFHAMRKIVSRMVSFYDTRRSLAPCEQTYQMSRYLSAINGLMGGMHDDLVESAVSGLQDYHRDAFLLPQDIRSRLLALTQTPRNAAPIDMPSSFRS